MALPSPRVAAVGTSRRPRFEVADVVRAYGDEYLRTHAASTAQRRVLRAIAHCRSAALGGHVEACHGCGYRRIAYNSCRNRHCPKCQGKERARWLASELGLLLPVPYFHLVCTLPHRLNPLVRANRRLLLDLLLRAAAHTLRSFALDPRHLGAELAITMVLHTWGQQLGAHYHVHCVVSGGGLGLDGRSWVTLPRRPHRPGRRARPFLFPVAALSEVFRHHYLAALAKLRQRAQLRYHGDSAALANPVTWARLVSALEQQPWVVYCKAPFGGPAQVLKYLSRYTHRVAIANHRLRFVGDGIVRFEYRDYTDHQRTKQRSLPASEFLHRFLLHVVPRGFMRIRHYGLLANRQRATKLARARELLGAAAPVPLPESTTPAAASAFTSAAGPDAAPAPTCPNCGGPLQVLEFLPPARADGPQSLAAAHDTS